MKELKGIYLAITKEFCRNGSPVLTLKHALAGGVRIVQLREKEQDMPKRDILALAKAFRKLTSAKKALFIVNDHIDIALSVKADGVHLGQEDLPLNLARKIAPRLIIGASSATPAQAFSAQKQGADYVNIGPLFPTNTKICKENPAGLRNLKKAASMLKVPLSAMGGIKENNLEAVFGAGADMAALITEITMAKDVKETAKRLVVMANTSISKSL